MSTCVWAQGESLRILSASFGESSIQAGLRFCPATAAAEISARNTANADTDFIEALCIGFDRFELHRLGREFSQYSSLPSYIISETLKRLLIFTALPTSVAKRTSPLVASMNGFPSIVRGKTNLAPRPS